MKPRQPGNEGAVVPVFKVLTPADPKDESLSMIRFLKDERRLTSKSVSLVHFQARVFLFIGATACRYAFSS